MLLVSRPVAATDDDFRTGIFWMLVTTFFFVSVDAIAKYLVVRYPAAQVIWGRFLFHFLFALLIVAPQLKQVVRSNRPGLQLTRSALLLLTTALFFFGIGAMELADASAIMFISPILVTVLAIPLLGEAVGPRRWVAVAVGFVGALIVVRPGTGIMGGSAGLFLAAAASNALYQLATRKLRGVDDPLTTLVYTAMVGAVGLTLALPLFWQPLAWMHFALLAALGALGCIGHFTLVKAFQAAPAAVVAPFSYASLVWSALLGFIIFDDLPDRWTVLGAAIIAAGGLYILHRERVKQVGSHAPAVNP